MKVTEKHVVSVVPYHDGAAWFVVATAADFSLVELGKMPVDNAAEGWILGSAAYRAALDLAMRFGGARKVLIEEIREDDSPSTDTFRSNWIGSVLARAFPDIDAERRPGGFRAQRVLSAIRQALPWWASVEPGHIGAGTLLAGFSATLTGLIGLKGPAKRAPTLNDRRLDRLLVEYA